MICMPAHIAFKPLRQRLCLFASGPFHVFGVECFRVAVSQLYSHRAAVPKGFAELPIFTSVCSQVARVLSSAISTPGHPGLSRAPCTLFK